MAEPVTPLSAATTIVLRSPPLEVLMMRRVSTASFVPDATVFPGGVASPEDHAVAAAISDGSLLNAMRVAAARELFEESGIWCGAPLDDPEQARRDLLDGTTTMEALAHRSRPEIERLVWTSRWITPEGVPKRFDTWFFLLHVGKESVATLHAAEAVELFWIAPKGALERRKELRLVFPTIKNLEAITDFEDPEALLDSRRNASIETVQPVIIDGSIRLVR